MIRVTIVLSLGSLLTYPLYAQVDVQDGIAHLDGAFKAAEVTWNDDYLPVIKWKYNHNGAPQTTSFATISNLIDEAFFKWNYIGTLHRISFGKHGTFSTVEGFVRNSVNVILWEEGLGFGVQCDTQHSPKQDPPTGSKTVTGADILCNPETTNGWWVGETAPSTRDSEDTGFDFVETIMHELGHVVGLTHTITTINDQLMHGDYDTRAISPRSFGDGDRAGAVYQHPTLSITSFPGYDLALTAETNVIQMTADVAISHLLDVENGTLELNSSTRKLTIINGGKLLIRESGTVRDGQIIVANGGELVVRNGGVLDDSHVTVQSGGDITVDEGEVTQGIIDVEGGGTVTVREGAQVYGVDISISSGGLFVSEDGTHYKFDVSEGIYSQGKVEIDGGIFEKNGPGEWDYIYLHGAGSDGSFIKNADISGNEFGIHTNQADNLVFDNVTSTGNQYHGIKIYDSQGVDVFSSTFNNNGSSGAYVDNSGSIYFRTGCVFNFNAQGLTVRGNSSAFVGDGFEHGEAEVRNNDGVGLNVYNDSDLYTGYGTHVNLAHGGYNSIHGNGTYDATAGSGSNNVSMWNYWGTSSPQASQFHTSGGGVLDYDYWLTSAPGKGGPARETERSISARSKPGHFVRQVYEAASESRANAEALTQAHVNDPDARIAKKARMLYMSLLKRRDISAGVSYGEELLLDRSFADWERATIAKQLFYAYLREGKQAKAREKLAELRSLEDEDWESGLLAAVYEDMIGAQPVLESETSGKLTEEFITVESYPDPFNSSAVIRYFVSSKGRLTLRVFDVIGRQVAVLVDEVKQPGTHEARFDASSLQSGVYLYQVTTASGKTSGQMHLVK